MQKLHCLTSLYYRCLVPMFYANTYLIKETFYYIRNNGKGALHVWQRPYLSTWERKVKAHNCFQTLPGNFNLRPVGRLLYNYLGRRNGAGCAIG